MATVKSYRNSSSPTDVPQWKRELIFRKKTVTKMHSGPTLGLISRASKISLGVHRSQMSRSGSGPIKSMNNHMAKRHCSGDSDDLCMSDLQDIYRGHELHGQFQGSDIDEEFQYGPGIVSKLKNKYLSLALREGWSRPSLRRSSSMEHLGEKEGVTMWPHAPVISTTKGYKDVAASNNACTRKEQMKRSCSVDSLSQREEFRPSSPSVPKSQSASERISMIALATQDVVVIETTPPLTCAAVPVSHLSECGDEHGVHNTNHRRVSISNVMEDSDSLPPQDTVWNVKQIFEPPSMTTGTSAEKKLVIPNKPPLKAKPSTVLPVGTNPKRVLSPVTKISYNATVIQPNSHPQANNVLPRITHIKSASETKSVETFPAAMRSSELVKAASMNSAGQKGSRVSYSELAGPKPFKGSTQANQAGSPSKFSDVPGSTHSGSPPPKISPMSGARSSKSKAPPPPVSSLEVAQTPDVTVKCSTESISPVTPSHKLSSPIPSPLPTSPLLLRKVIIPDVFRGENNIVGTVNENLKNMEKSPLGEERPAEKNIEWNGTFESPTSPIVIVHSGDKSEFAPKAPIEIKKDIKAPTEDSPKKKEVNDTVSVIGKVKTPQGFQKIDNNSIVFNFTSSRKETPDYIENDGVDLSKRRPGLGGYIPIPVMEGWGDSSTDPDEDMVDVGSMGLSTSYPNVEFEGDGVIINGRSNLQRQPKNRKNVVGFNDSMTRLFEYPSELSLMEEEASSSGSSLANYLPSKIQLSGTFELGISQTASSSTSPSAAKGTAKDKESDDFIRPASDTETVTWSAERTSDMLF